MLQDEQIETIITKAINIIELEVGKIEDKQETSSLSREDTDKVIDFLKTLIIVQKEKRQVAKDDELDMKELPKDELDRLIAIEAAKAKEANGK